MPLTPHSTLRERVLLALWSRPGGTATRAAVLNDLETVYRDQWTLDDLRPQTSRPWEAKWRNRASFERISMVDEGLLSGDANGSWTLTPLGASRAAQLLEASDDALSAERARREAMWSQLVGAGGPIGVPAKTINELRLFRGGRGIYADGDSTRGVLGRDGATVSLLHNGSSYADELAVDGVRYHYPRTARPGRDRAEIQATKEAYRRGLPVFVVTAGTRSNLRTVHRGYVEDYDDELEMFLITFTDEELPPGPPAGEDDTPFSLTGPLAEKVYSARRNRPNQQRFAFAVLRRYGEECAACGLAVGEVLHAAHLRPKKDSGSDDARNGLPLCANHHIALDVGLWSIEPKTTKFHSRPVGPTLADLGITRSDLRHLPSRPHIDALRHLWVSQGYAAREEEL